MAPTTSTLLGVASVFVSAWNARGEGSVCQDATNETNPECYSNIVWAKEHGITEDKEWYKNYPHLNKDSSLAEFQFALALPGDSRSWNCSMPCSLTDEQKTKFADAVLEAHEAVGDAVSKEVSEFQKFGADIVSDAAGAVAGAPEASFAASMDSTTQKPSEGWTWVNYMLLAIGICCLLPCLGLCCSAFICYESVAWIFGGSDKPEKKKKARGVKVVKAPEAPAAAAPVPMQAPAPTASSFIAVAQPVYTTAPVVHHVAAPVTYTAAPVQHVAAAPVHYVAQAAPVVQQAASVSMAAPGSVSMAAPGSVSMAAPGSLSMPAPGSVSMAAPGSVSIAAPMTFA
eukprot:TRINITY_DN2053_c0_g1_i7.p1 TRINITY_DN2053_c0_g1~~TRINITY_DN2053_c0_g1_i7.p1  ORF type:complete len:342 (+),score=72.31 TRINITY_DN2053_c0_g1_i7:72-1097(+)